ncbi:DEAD/DEAH box helicase [Oerskovia jenensis]|uniref:ATP-dependent Lhr-like helicase n=1 Tax=Oerskovia jenensis TaxID=162169 RepID=A0ABS2LBI0_9CELL|nr:DEAD/DEAH box helicase [Oerskovia jenensis]MBM7477780.1 ATP-dependent Lhr-like helicase [Oerskovia jenensis]
MTSPAPLAGFSAPTRAWFEGAFERPTAAQAGAWEAIGSGRHALVVAPTGSGKTLAAFLWSLDRLLSPGSGPGQTDSPDDPAHRCKILYVSPLKALAADVERNLRSPLAGIRQAAVRLGTTVPDVVVGTRTGDTPASERRRFGIAPPDILITTPESLFLVLTSQARAGLAGVQTVIIDEIHAVAGTKRGAHLAVSLERLDALLPVPAQRVGLSATVRPVEAVATFLAGHRSPQDQGREVVVVQPPSTKRIEVDIVVPVPDLSDLRGAAGPGGSPGQDGLPPLPDGEPDLSGPATGRPQRPSVWPHVDERVVDLVAEHRSTLVFTNSRRGAERLTARMNEVWAERQGEDVPDVGTLQPAQVLAQSGASAGTDPVIARAHHGSMSRAERTRTETELKDGRLPAVVATSSLELGIDMGAVDLVVQVGAPPSVASGLQRIGRAGHQVGAVSHGVIFPTFRGDLVPSAVIADRMRTGQIEHLHVLSNPLDVLAQQVVAMVALDDWTVADLAALVRRSAPYGALGDATLHAVLDMLAGRYPSEDFGELRARIVWDRTSGVLSGRPGALRLAVTSGGTIPDRGLYGVFLATDSSTTAGPEDTAGVVGDAPGGAATGSRARGGRRVGELDEEMVYESRVGDTFTLGSSTWRIEDITPDRVLVTPAPGAPGRLPFWKGDSPGRPAELGRAVGAWVRELETLAATDGPLTERLRGAGLDAWATDNLMAYLAGQREATGRVPDDRTVVVERFRDELGDWRVVIHSPYGAKVHAPWALVLGARLRDRYGLDAAAMHSDDGIVLRLPDLGDGGWGDERGGAGGPGAAGPGATGSPVVTAEDLLLVPEEVLDEVRSELGGSIMFAARFREAAARALLLPRRRPDKRQPLWQQRQRSAQLLSVASEYPEFPIVLEAARECLQDDFDVAALTELMRDLAAGRVRLVDVTTPTPSPFAQSLLFGYTAQFLYDGDAPLAERRAAALSLDPTLLAELLGTDGGASQLADLLDPESVERTEAELGALVPNRQARHAEDVWDLLRRLGPLPVAEVARRTREDVRDEAPAWLAALEGARRVVQVRLAGVPDDAAQQWAVVEDAGRLRDALGVALPTGIPEVFTEPVPDPLGDLVRRHARTHGPFSAHEVAARFGIGVAVATGVLRRLEAARVLVCGRLRPESLGGTGEEWCDAEVLRTLRRRSLAALRAEVEPVAPEALGVFLPRWHGIGTLRGTDGLLRVVEQLSGAAVPASALETLVLPSRVTDYSPALLDELTTTGEVLWCGHSSLPGGKDGLVSLHLADAAPLTLPDASPLEEDGPLDSDLHRAVVDLLTGSGGFFLPRIAELAGASQAATLEALWDLVWAGWVTNDGLGALRSRLGPGGGAHRAPRAPVRARPLARGRFASLGAGTSGTARGESDLRGGSGRWSALPARELDPTRRTHALTRVLLDRHGVLTRGAAPSEGVTNYFRGVYRVLSELETTGTVRRGYFVEHLGGSQFALPGAVDQLRTDAQDREHAEESPGRRELAALLLAATDPANPYGAALPWPEPHVPHEPGGGSPAGIVTPGAVSAARKPSAAVDPAPGSAGTTTSTAVLPSTGAARPASRATHRPGRKVGSVVVLVGGDLVLYVERGGRSLLSFGDDSESSARRLALACAELARASRAGLLGKMVIGRIDGIDALAGAGSTASRAFGVTAALLEAGFRPTPRGLRA